MSTQISKSLIALFFLGMFVTGCNTNTKQTADNDIKFDSIRVDRTYHLLNNPDNPNCNLQLNFTYPAKFSDKEILKKIQNDFVLSYFGENYENLSPEEAVAKYTEDYLNNYKELEADFLKFATERGMVGIKGHRSVGGFRASCYNALPKESVQALIDCMQEFEKLH